ncbi:hypothetical protein LP421_15135 [Rhizobium sp. RCAM05350]|nr:hypothetical protein LP421_15135 [Rhizobium sp. RCAM05350]
MTLAVETNSGKADFEQSSEDDRADHKPCDGTRQKKCLPSDFSAGDGEELPHGRPAHFQSV